MKKTYWKNGDYSALCDVCGFKFKASKLKERWDGLKVCTQDWEQRHPQEFLRVIPENSKLPWTRPEPQDIFYVPIGAYDSVTMLDELSRIMHFVDTFTDSVTMVDILTIVKGKIIADSFTMNSSGTLTLPTYVDPTYFASDFMATSVAFT